MPGLLIESGIDKLVIDGSMLTMMIGLEGDEQDKTFYGGPSKAV